MAEKLRYHLRHAILAHFETLRKVFYESKPSTGPIWYQNLDFSLHCRLTSLKLKQIFCNQKIKIKGGMQATAIFQKWNHFWRMVEKHCPHYPPIQVSMIFTETYCFELKMCFMLFVRETKSNGRYIKLYSRNYKAVCTR